MTWHVSFSGPKEDVKAKVAEKVTDFHKHPEVAVALGKLIDDQVGPNVSISGSGSDTSCSLSISSST
jgi:hypothetical protein